MMRHVGPAIIVLLCAQAAALSITSLIAFGLLNAVSIALAAASLVAMSQCFVLAARPGFLEPLFGGLDRMYRVHKWLGISSLAMMLGHQTIEPHFKRWTPETRLGDFAGELGEIALYGLVSLILLSWFKRIPYLNIEIPYQLWRFSHRFTGLLFALAALHQLFTDKPIAGSAPLAVYLNTFCVIGLAAYAYTELLAKRLLHREFAVAEILHHASATDILLTPRAKPMRWKPGQFAFVSAPEAGLSEPHPFTIANAPNDAGQLKVSIKALGDWTQKLPLALRKGMTVVVEGPYGRFNFRKGATQQIWLAGGIGITPFLAWAESLTGNDPHKIHLVYCVSEAAEVLGREILDAAAARNPGFTIDIVVTREDGRLTADRLKSCLPFPIKTADLYFCGPTALKDSILNELRAKADLPRAVHFELFEFR